MAEKKIRPFDFSRIKKLSRQFLNITEALLEAYPVLQDPEELGKTLLKSMASDLRLGLSLQFVGYDEVSQSQFLNSLATPCAGVILEAQPQGQRILIDMDYTLAALLVDQLLGGEGEPPAQRVPFSPAEEGVLEFLWAKTLHHLKAATGLMGPSTLCLQKIVYEPKQMAGVEGSEALGVVFKFFLGLKKNGGYLKVYFPHPALEGLLLREDALSGLLPPEESWERRINRVSHIRTSLCSEIGRVQLAPGDKEQLEEGDVVLFDETLATMGPRGVQGKTVLRVGENAPEGLLGELVDSEGKLVVKVLDYYGGTS